MFSGNLAVVAIKTIVLRIKLWVYSTMCAVGFLLEHRFYDGLKTDTGTACIQTLYRYLVVLCLILIIWKRKRKNL